MRKTSYIISVLLFSASVQAFGQMPDTTGIYGERKDTLDASVFVGRQEGNYLSKGKDIRTEVISAAGLCKMACCNLAESFENSASVTVGYSDAVTGARQIRLLGQSGICTQMLDENRPVMRGLSAPFGLNYVPGQWLESIQIAKGVTSVINGVESMTGQINMEHRKPTDEKPLYLQASVMDDSKIDFNLASSIQFDELSTWSTVFLAHIDGNLKAMDMNGDGFMDDPQQLNIALSNRWLYFGQNGVQVRFGVRAIQDNRVGGQIGGDGKRTSFFPERSHGTDFPLWQASITNRSLNGYVKVGIPLNEANTSNVALVADATGQSMSSGYGNSVFNVLTSDFSKMPAHSGIGYRFYNAFQQTFFANLLYQNQDSERHHFTLGLSEMLDIWSDAFNVDCYTGPTLSDTGAFGEYTFRDGDVFSAIVGLRGDYYNVGGFRFSPRLTLKWAPSEEWVFRGNAGRGIRYSTPLVDNFGVLSTAKPLSGDFQSHPLEDSWTFGANATWYMPFDDSGKTYLSADWFYTTFTSQMLYSHEDAVIGTYAGKPVHGDVISFYELGSLVGDNYSYTNNFQLDFSTEPFRGFTATLTGRITDARQTLKGQSDDVKPMTSLYKGVLNLQYAARLNKWIFDFTASVNGPCRVWDFMKDITVDGEKIYADGYTPVYPLLYAQVTKRFKGVDVYVGGENLTGYTQPMPIISADDPFGSNFDASCVWGPVMGLKLYAGVRFTLWKK